MAPSQILFFGDSITVGYTDSVGLGWPGRICHALHDGNGRPTTVYNLGVNGDTWRGCAKRWYTETMARCTDRPLGALVFAFGVNDAATIVGQGRQVELEESSSHALAVLTAASHLAPVLCIGPTPVDERVNPIANGDSTWEILNADLAAYGSAYAEIAARVDVPSLDLMTPLGTDVAYISALGDGIHPTDEGFRRIADVITAWDAWLTLVR